MKTTIMNLIVVTALSFSAVALAAEMGSKTQHPAANTVAPAMPPAPAAVSAAPSAQASQPGLQPSTPPKPAKAKSARSKSLDLRHCLDLETNAAIAKCAGE